MTLYSVLAKYFYFWPIYVKLFYPFTSNYLTDRCQIIWPIHVKLFFFDIKITWPLRISQFWIGFGSTMDTDHEDCILSWIEPQKAIFTQAYYRERLQLSRRSATFDWEKIRTITQSLTDNFWDNELSAVLYAQHTLLCLSYQRWSFSSSAKNVLSLFKTSFLAFFSK